MKVHLFQRRFARLVRQGTKRTTIRPRRKNPTRVGDALSLRAWSGKPYRSKQVTLLDGIVCAEVHGIEILRRSDWVSPTYYESRVICRVDGNEVKSDLLREGEWDRLAQADGFKHAGDMLDWFIKEHGLPFSGDLIRW